MTFAEGSQLKTISNSAFNGCSELTEIEIPASVTSIGEQAFANCSALANVTFAENSQLQTIGQYAFANCPALNYEITLPNTDKTTWYSALDINTEIKNENRLSAENSKITLSNYNYCFATKKPVFEDGNSNIKNNIINDEANGVKYKIKTVANGSTAGTVSVSRVFNNNVDAIKILSTVTITQDNTTYTYKVTSIGDDAFENCVSLTAINVDTKNEYYSSQDGILFDNGKTKLIKCPETKVSVEIPSTVTSISNSAFSQCKFTAIEIPASVTSIGDYAFDNCVLLTAINVDTKNEYYSSKDGILFNKSQTQLIKCPETKVSVEIPASVIEIAPNAFSGCKALTNGITLPTVSGKVWYKDGELLLDNVINSGNYESSFKLKVPAKINRTTASIKTSGSVTLSVSNVSELEDGTTYQWYKNTSNSTTGGTAVDGATSSSLKLSKLKKGTYYYYCVTSSGITEVCKVKVTATESTTISYIVLYNANGGNCKITSSEVTSTVASVSPYIGSMPTATRDGYTFLGWYTSITGDTKVTGNTPITSNTTLYAHWLKNVVLTAPTNIVMNGKTATWTASKGASYYKVSKIVNGKTDTGTKVTGTSYKFKYLAEGVEHEIYVTAYNDDGEKMESSKIKYTPAVKLTAPTNVVMNGKTATWTASKGASYYKVSKIVNGKTYTGIATEDTSYKFKYLAEGVEHEIYVTAYNDDGESISSEKITVKAVKNISVTATGVVTFDDVDGASYYRVFKKYDGVTKNAKTDSSPYTFKSFKSGTEHIVYVKAYDNADNEIAVSKSIKITAK